MKKQILAITLLLILQVTSLPVESIYAQVTTKNQGPPPTVPAVSPEAIFETLKQLDVPENPEAPAPSFERSNAPLQSAIARQPVRVERLAKRNFRSNENLTLKVNNATSSEITAVVTDTKGETIDVEVTNSIYGDAAIVKVAPPRQFRPGKYKLTITDGSGQSYQQDFTWGVLAINTNKSVYTPYEKANLAIGVLDERGEMVCDAKVDLKITTPASRSAALLSTENGKITVNPECTSHDFTLKPDYEAQYHVGDAGKYTMTLTAVTKNGTFTIDDSFEVRETVPFSVERVSATRIYPPHKYPVLFNITANQDFEGKVTETVPYDFTITPSETHRSYDTMETVTINQDNKNVLGASTSALAIPFVGDFPISQGFGAKVTDADLRSLYSNYGLAGHDGIDFPMPVGTEIVAVDDGVIVLADEAEYGETVVIQHKWGRSYYGHLSKILVGTGNKVVKDQIIGLSGNSGYSTGPHLHFGMKPNTPDMKNGYYGKLDPLPYFGINTGQQVLGASIDAYSERVKVLTWNLSIKKGEKVTLGYTYKAPLISPEFYTLGPLKFSTTEDTVFTEARMWQIAADAIATAGSRIFDADRTAVAAEDVSVANWPKNRIFIVTIGVQTSGADRCDQGDTYAVQWRNATTGTSFTNLSASGELKSTTSTALVDAAALSQAESGITGSGTFVSGEEEETGPGSWSNRFDEGEWSAVQFSVDPADGLYTSQYQFRLSVSCETLPTTPLDAVATLTLGPELERVMRHGKWFDLFNTRQPFTF